VPAKVNCRIAPTRSSEAPMTDQLLAPLHPDEGALTPLFRANCTDAMLREIAEADYGWKADECHARLRQMCKTGAPPPDDFNLREVLELIRWSEPHDPTWKPGAQGHSGHWMRLFACTALLRFAAAHSRAYDNEFETVGQFTASAIELGEPVTRAAASVLTWRFLTYPGDDADPVFLAFAILLLAARLQPGGGERGGPWLKDLAEWVEGLESRVRKEHAVYFGGGSESLDDPWLLGLARQGSLKEGTWKSLALQVLARPERPHPGAAREQLQLLGELVAGI
jgi:hypothetical protein